jgi:predicted signal transduction protein with EAL and GGDEF domain
LCETIIELGRRFGLKTVAEGIETNHDAHKLQAIGCELGQGYLFAKPMPKEQRHHLPSDEDSPGGALAALCDRAEPRPGLTPCITAQAALIVFRVAQL